MVLLHRTKTSITVLHQLFKNELQFHVFEQQIVMRQEKIPGLPPPYTNFPGITSCFPTRCVFNTSLSLLYYKDQMYALNINHQMANKFSGRSFLKFHIFPGMELLRENQPLSRFTGTFINCTLSMKFLVSLSSCSRSFCTDFNLFISTSCTRTCSS